MRSGKFWLLGCATGFLAAAQACAETIVLPDIDVTAPQSPEQPAATTDSARDRIWPRAGANAYQIGGEAIAQSPQGENAPIDKLLLQAPGVSLDSAAGGMLHVRNEHANVQYRIDGVMLPDGVSGFGSMLETSFVGGLTLLTGALPAQYGLRTAGVVEIASKSNAFDNNGSVGVYGGSRGNFTPSFEYGGTIGQTQYFFAGRFLTNELGIENPTASVKALHDHTDQGRFFGYVASRLDDGSRLSFITGTSVGAYQIPNNPNQPQFPGASDFLPPGAGSLNSSQLNERQYETNLFNTLAWQKSFGASDLQIAYYSRYSTLRFDPDALGDLAFNGVASHVERNSFLNGVQADGAWRATDAHTLRAGLYASGEQTRVGNASTVFPTDDSGNINGAPFAAPFDGGSKFGVQFGGYVQDEWKIDEKWTLNAGLRFDQFYQYVDANQFSPRINLTYRPVDGATLHAGFARYFSPPSQALSAPSNLALFAGTTGAAALNMASPVLPERSSYFDIGWDQKLFGGLTAGIDAYYKTARDLLDDGQFGQALVLTAFNYDKAVNQGIEFKLNYEQGDFRAYGNLAWARQVATRVVSNQYLFDLDEYAYIANHYIPTDHAQTLSGSAGLSYLWERTRFSADMIYGSGLRSGFANLEHVPAYAQFNFGLSREFKMAENLKPTTIRFDIVNVFDSIYVIRDGSGIGVFAPQYGPRRGFFIGISQKI